MTPSFARVVDRFLVREAARLVVSSPLSRTARRNKDAARVRQELTAEVLEAFAEAMGSVTPGVRVGCPDSRVAGVSRRLKQLWDAFQTAPQKWEQFKKMLGVRATSYLGVVQELPGKIKRMFGEAKKYLAQLGPYLKKKIPVLALYMDVGVKLPSLGDWMKNSLFPSLPPSVQRALSAIGTKARSLAEWVDILIKQHRVLKPAGSLISGGIFGFIWWNVAELSWDIPQIIRGFLGGYSFVELLHSLPESAIGFVVALMFPGLPGGLVWNILLPATVALRLSWMIRKKYIKVEGRSLEMNWSSLGIDPSTKVQGMSLFPM